VKDNRKSCKHQGQIKHSKNKIHTNQPIKNQHKTKTRQHMLTRDGRSDSDSKISFESRTCSWRHLGSGSGGIGGWGGR